ncbi:MAG: indole-3-glycerol phosphate synthase TrpC [Clostridiales bacterium]|nr:indole-3-glycerol phosphate synthase TrpC [Clostridiales bacterium]
MILDEIVAEKKRHIEERKKNVSLEEIRNKALKLENEENNFFNVLKKPGLSVIGEFKKASPSKGLILPEFNVEEIESLYRELKIDAYSVLTEEDFFQGSDENLQKVKTLSNTPILRKDFIVDFYQIYEAKLLGAQGILLIVAELGNRLKEFYDECIKFNLEPLIEVHNKEELDIALEAGGRIIGINNRNLKNFVTTLEITKELIKYIPDDKVIISESGMSSIEDLEYIKSLGADGVLVGEMFMRNIRNQDFINKFKKFKGED